MSLRERAFFCLESTLTVPFSHPNGSRLCTCSFYFFYWGHTRYILLSTGFFTPTCYRACSVRHVHKAGCAGPRCRGSTVSFFTMTFGSYEWWCSARLYNAKVTICPDCLLQLNRLRTLPKCLFHCTNRWHHGPVPCTLPAGYQKSSFVTICNPFWFRLSLCCFSY